PQHGHSFGPFEPAHVAGLPQDGEGPPTRDRSREAVQRRRLKDRHQLRQVLADDVVYRHGERRLVVLPPHQRRAVGLREDREAEADDEERDCDRSAARMARERQRSQAHGRRAAPSPALEEAEARRERACDYDGRDEGDQRGEEEENRAGPAFVRKCARVGRPTSAAAPAMAAANRIPRPAKVECPRIAPPGTSARSATSAPIPVPAAQPTTAPTTATATTSATETSTSCQRRAPYHVNRRHSASASRRSPIAASTANASSSAAASPPISSSRRPATFPVASAARSSSTGAVKSNASDSASTAERVRCTRPANRSIVPGCP